MSWNFTPKEGLNEPRIFLGVPFVCRRQVEVLRMTGLLGVEIHPVRLAENVRLLPMTQSRERCILTPDLCRNDKRKGLSRFLLFAGRDRLQGKPRHFVDTHSRRRCYGRSTCH